VSPNTLYIRNARWRLRWGSDHDGRTHYWSGIVRGRVGMMLKGLSADDQAKALAWFDGLPVSQGKAMSKALVGKR
jgi:hypothetical protein